MDLELRWVEAIHARMLVRYGSAWVSKWQNIPEDAVRADWSSTLANIPPHAIKHALEHLPDEFPPTATQFRNLCLSVPRNAEPPAIAPPPADPQRVAAELARLPGLIERQGPKAWAYALQEREKRGDALSITQRTMWRAALASGDGLSNFAGDFTPVDPNALPPGMRADMGAQP